MLSPAQQAVELIKKSRNVLIALPESLNGDALGSALALEAALKTQNKKAETVSPATVPANLQFLPGVETIKNKLAPWRDFIISVDTSQNKISRLRYETENNVLKIFLTAPQKIEQQNIKLEAGTFYYDLIVTINSPDMESLGHLFEENTELFFSRPILNIDHEARNEGFGEVNLIEPTAAACTEIIYNLIDLLGLGDINQKYATELLTGLIAKTRSFQNTKTTPQALSLASLLVAKGAEQEKIIQYLYKTKSLPQLKLWGRLLSRLEVDEEKNQVWVMAEAEDFIASGTSAGDLPFVLEEIQELFPQLGAAFVLWADQTGEISLLVQTKQPELLRKLNLELSGRLKNDTLLALIGERDSQSARQKISSLLSLAQ